MVLDLCQATLADHFLPQGHPKKYSGPMPTESQILLQLADGLSYIHEKQVLHYDIKPQNVLISTSHSNNETPVVKWSDIGINKYSVYENDKMDKPKGIHFEVLTWLPLELTVKVFFRTPSRSHVEDLIESDEFTVRGNVFSAGCLFAYIILGGIHPFQDEEEPGKSDLRTTLRNIIDDKIPRKAGIVSIHPKSSRGICKFILIC